MVPIMHNAQMPVSQCRHTLWHSTQHNQRTSIHPQRKQNMRIIRAWLLRDVTEE
jgi:hypothetical protein